MGGEKLWSTYSRCPQRDPFLHPPATPKFAWSPVAGSGMMKPPPVTKSLLGFGVHGGEEDWALTEPLASARASARMRGARRVRVARMSITPHRPGRGSGPEDHV